MEEIVPYLKIIGPADERPADIAGRAPELLDTQWLHLELLEVEDLHRVVSWLVVTTAAQTKNGLINAIKNHLGIT